MALLPDGTFIPSYLNTYDSSESKGGFALSINEVKLRVGLVTEAYSPSDKRNRSKRRVEYDVDVFHRNENGIRTTIRYYNLEVASMFGSFADYFFWTPRIETTDKNKDLNRGSYVLIMCLNGDMRSGYIVGAMRHPSDDTKQLSFKEGPYLDFEYNGIYINIDKDGTFSLIHRGATKSDGTIKDESGKNSSIRFTKEGNITLGYSVEKNKDGGVKENSDELPYIILNKPDKELHFFANSDIASETKDRYLIKTTNGVKINDGGSEPQSFLRSTIYRQEEQTMHSKIMPLLASLQSLIQSAGSSLNSAGSTLTTAGSTLVTVTIFHKIPVAGPILGSIPLTATASSMISAGATLISAGGFLNQAGPLFAQIQSAIQSFESSAQKYLSNKHYHSESA